MCQAFYNKSVYETEAVNFLYGKIEALEFTN